MMEKKVLFTLLALIPAMVFGQQNTVSHKYALIIGNGNYNSMALLSNPVNDANDMSESLRSMGFTVDTVVNGSLDQMENAVVRLKNRLSVSNEAYGFFFYAGHGVQSGGDNYLIPVNASIPSESFLRQRAVSVQSVLDELNSAGNYLNIVVLDACRDNPLSHTRGGGRGLAVVANQPTDSVIVYATSAGSVADDGNGRNGLFTHHLLNNLRNGSTEVHELFRRTGADVAEASGRRQVPAIYNQFFGTAYLASNPVARQSSGGTIAQSQQSRQQQPQNTPKAVPTPTPDPIPELTIDKDNWKKKWVYFGPALGYGIFNYINPSLGSYSDYYSQPDYFNSFGLSIRLLLDIHLFSWLSLSSGISLGITNEPLFSLPLMLQLGIRPGRLELSAKAGAYLGTFNGFVFGGTLGLNIARPGKPGTILFLSAEIMPRTGSITETISGSDIENVEMYMLYAGLKFGVGRSRKW